MQSIACKLLFYYSVHVLEHFHYSLLISKKCDPTKNTVFSVVLPKKTEISRISPTEIYDLLQHAHPKTSLERPPNLYLLNEKMRRLRLKGTTPHKTIGLTFWSLFLNIPGHFERHALAHLQKWDQIRNKQQQEASITVQDTDIDH